jgi:hypothetical protein
LDVNFAVTGVRLRGFGSVGIDADFRSDGAGDKAPTSYVRSGDGDSITILWNDASFQGGLVGGSLPSDPQESSLFPSFVTDSTEFALTGTATIFGYVIDPDRFEDEGVIVRDPGADLVTLTVEGLAVPVPATVVPLPASVLLLGAGVAGLGLMRRRSTS